MNADPELPDVRAFDPYSCDIGLLRYLNGLSRGKRIWVSLSFVILVAIVFIVVAAVDGRLLDTTADRESLARQFPLIGDYAVITLFALQVTNLHIINRQWTHMETFFVDLCDNKVVILPDRAIAQINSKIDKINRRFSRIGGDPEELQSDAATTEVREESSFNQMVDGPIQPGPSSIVKPWRLMRLVIPAASLAFSWIIYRQIGPESVFDRLDPEYAVEAYRSWWASSTSTYGRPVFIAMTAFFLMYVGLQNIVGISVAKFFVWFYRSQRDQLQLSANFSTPEKYLGWQPLRRLYNTITWSMICNFLSLLLIFLVFRNLVFVALATLFLVALSYLILPYMILRPRLREYRESMRHSIIARAESKGPDDSQFERLFEIQGNLDMIERATPYRLIGPTNHFSQVIGLVASAYTVISFF